MDARRDKAHNLPLNDLHVCLIEDDRATANIIARWLEAAGARTTWLASFEAAKQAVEGSHDHQGWINLPNECPEVVLCDLILPDGNGLDVLTLWRKQFPQVPVVMLTAFATVDTAVQCMKQGAFDFLRKPISADDLNLALAKARSHGDLLRENHNLGAAVRVLSMAQTLSGIAEKSQLLKTLGRLLYRESRMQECYVMFHNASRTQTESLLDVRAPGLARRFPEEVISQYLAPIIAAQPPPPDNFVDTDLSLQAPPQTHYSEDGEAIIISLLSPTGNLGFVVLLQKEKFSRTLPRLEELQPILVQAARSMQALDVAAALSFVDELTGLYNQRFLDAALTSEVARANRYGTPVSLLFIDLDKFKSINDNHGHIVGSQIIREAAKILKSQMRDTDQLMRYGGDEFVVILPSTPLSGAKVVAERIRVIFEQSFFDVRQITGVDTAVDLNVTTSIGGACLPECAFAMQELIQLADDAMYVSKRSGRNSVSLAKLKETT